MAAAVRNATRYVMAKIKPPWPVSIIKSEFMAFFYKAINRRPRIKIDLFMGE
jgi:hypothetical protein